MRWLVRVEGVNFSATISDTNDLSTMRGGSLALLNLHAPVQAALHDLKPELIYAGASQCAFFIENKDDESGDDIRRDVIAKVKTELSKLGPAKEPFPWLTVVADIVSVQDGDEAPVAVQRALDEAEALSRVRQFRSWTIDPMPLVPGNKGVGHFERARPGQLKPTFLPKAKVLLREGEWTEFESEAEAGWNDKEKETDTAQRAFLSEAVAAKRIYGRVARQRFYYDELDKPGGHESATVLLGPYGEPAFHFTQSIEDIVANPPSELPVSSRTKIAVIYADGNGFGKMARDPEIGTTSFAEQIAPLRRKLLSTMLRTFVDSTDTHRVDCPYSVYAKVDGQRRDALRFETILWGGDELMFVMPAWLAFHMTSVMLNVMKDWAISDTLGQPHRLFHALGVVIAHHKTPIRQLQVIAKKAADLVKTADQTTRDTLEKVGELADLKSQNTVSFEIFESQVPPDVKDGLAPLRRRSFGRLEGFGDDADAVLAAMTAIPGAAYSKLIDRLAALRGESGPGYPRSQIYAALRAARSDGQSIMSAKGSEAARASIAAYEKRMGLVSSEVDENPGRTVLEEEFLPCVLSRGRPYALDLAMIAAFWDYATLYQKDMEPTA